MKNNLANKFLFAAFLAFTAINCSSAAPNLAINSNITAANSDDAVIKTQETDEAVAAVAVIAPEALVADLYKQHDANNSQFFQTKNRALVDKFFAKNLADLIWKAAVGSAHNLDFDPLYASVENKEISKVVIGKSVTNGGKAFILIMFENYGEKQKLKYMLTKENNRWKIEDII